MFLSLTFVPTKIINYEWFWVKRCIWDMTLLGFEGNRGENDAFGAAKNWKKKKKKRCMWTRGILGLAWLHSAQNPLGKIEALGRLRNAKPSIRLKGVAIGTPNLSIYQHSLIFLFILNTLIVLRFQKSNSLLALAIWFFSAKNPWWVIWLFISILKGIKWSGYIKELWCYMAGICCGLIYPVDVMVLVLIN